MKLTTISERLYEEACRGIVENDGEVLGYGGFDWDEMLKNASTIKTVNSYMKNCYCPKLGVGSGRIAYLVKPGSKAGNGLKVDGPACLKIAKNMKGVAQNKAEADYLDELDMYSFAPVLYNADEAGLFTLVEAGTPVKNPRGKMVIDYFKDWDKWMSSKGLDKFGSDYRIVHPERTGFEDFFDSFLGELFHTDDEEEVSDIMEALELLSEDFPKYGPIYGFLYWLFEEGGQNDLEVLDFCQYSNWAFVKRHNEDVLIPIDFGFTSEVRAKYYL